MKDAERWDEDWKDEVERRLTLLEKEVHGKNGVLESLSGLHTKVDGMSGRITALLIFGGSLLLAILGTIIDHVIQ